MNTNPKAKRILCFGDSITKGTIPSTDDLYPINISWPGQLQDDLGNDYEVIVEGLPGRTIVAEEVGKPFKTGITHLKAILRSHLPLDLFIVMLGTNDIKDRFGLNSTQIAEHLDQFIKLAKETLKNSDTKIMIICPPAVVVPENGELEKKMLFGPEIFKELPELYKKVAENNDCLYINAGEKISLKNTDGFHPNEKGHSLLAEIITSEIKKIL